MIVHAGFILLKVMLKIKNNLNHQRDMTDKLKIRLLLLVYMMICFQKLLIAQPPVVPSRAELNSPFGEQDLNTFRNPPKVYSPETWFHFIGGNVANPG